MGYIYLKRKEMERIGKDGIYIYIYLGRRRNELERMGNIYISRKDKERIGKDGIYIYI